MHENTLDGLLTFQLHSCISKVYHDENVNEKYSQVP